MNKFGLNNGSGGKGCYQGGDGVIRELLFRKNQVLSILTERRTLSPYGLKGNTYHSIWSDPIVLVPFSRLLVIAHVPFPVSRKNFWLWLFSFKLQHQVSASNLNNWFCSTYYSNYNLHLGFIGFIKYQNFIRTLFHQWLILLYAKAGLWIFTPKYPQPANSTLLALVTIEHKRVLDNSGGQWSLMSLKAFVCLSIIFRWWRWKERVEFIVDIRW